MEKDYRSSASFYVLNLDQENGFLWWKKDMKTVYITNISSSIRTKKRQPLKVVNAMKSVKLAS